MRLGGPCIPMARTARRIAFSRIVDLSQEISPDTQMFPTYPQPAFVPWTTRDAQGFLAESLFLVSHTGTHVDAPWHFEPEGEKLDALDLERFVVPGHVLAVPGLGARERITPRHLLEARDRLDQPVRRGDAILLRTGWDRHLRQPAYLFDNPGLSGDAAVELVRWRPSLVGIDAANMDCAGDLAYPAHHALLRSSVLVLENVANLAALKGRRFVLVALPLRLRGATGSPVRLVALME